MPHPVIPARSRAFAAIALSVAFAAAGTTRVPPELGEPLPWRWLRQIAAHPTRSAVGALCIAAALHAPRDDTRRMSVERSAHARPIRATAAERPDAAATSRDPRASPRPAGVREREPPDRPR